MLHVKQNPKWKIVIVLWEQKLFYQGKMSLYLHACSGFGPPDADMFISKFNHYLNIDGIISHAGVPCLCLDSVVQCICGIVEFFLNRVGLSLNSVNSENLINH